MLNEEKITKLEFCVRVQIPLESKLDARPEEEHKRIALETFHTQFAAKANQEFQILSQPILTSDNAASFVFAGSYENPEIPKDEILELEERFKADYFSTIPGEWKPFYLYTRDNVTASQFV